jgi:hypothetical protein
MFQLQALFPLEQHRLYSISFSFIHTPMAVPLPISLGKRKTPVQATERPTKTLTDLQINFNHESVLLTDSKLSS